MNDSPSTSGLIGVSCASKKVTPILPGLEVVGHLDLIDLAGADQADGREVLQWLAVRIRGAGRVHGQAVARVKALQWRQLPMIELNKAAFDAAPDMFARNDADPELTH